MNERAISAMAGFLVLGLSPSFVDWQDNPGRRTEIAIYYGVALALLYIGVVRSK